MQLDLTLNVLQTGSVRNMPNCLQGAAATSFSACQFTWCSVPISTNHRVDPVPELGSLQWNFSSWDRLVAIPASFSELTFTFAICCRPSVCLSVCLSVCNARAPYSGGFKFRQFFYGVWYLGHPLTRTENFMEIVPGEPLRRRRS